MDLFWEFHKTGKFVKSMNSTFICLIPKKKEAESISNSRPIGLVSATYKVVSKVRAGRLKMAMGKLVSPFQHAFVEGPQTFDAAIIASEVVDFCLKKGGNGLICELDMERACNHV